MNRILEFIMCDVYNFIYFVVMNFVSLFNKLVQTPLPICIHKVKVRNVLTDSCTDVTKQYLQQKHWNASFDSDASIVDVTWSYENQTYRYACPLNNMIEFPPYTVEQIRYTKPKKIMSISIDDDPSYFELIRSYAGPLHNFYGKEFDTRWVLQKNVSRVTIIDSLGQIKVHGPKIEM